MDGLRASAAAAPVVKLHTKSPASPFPARSRVPLLIVAEYRLSDARAFEGTKDAVLPAASKVTVPWTGVLPGPLNVKVEGVSVAGSIASLNVAVRVVLTPTRLEPSTGAVEVTVGGSDPRNDVSAGSSVDPPTSK